MGALSSLKSKKNSNTIYFVVGPTASGKSNWALNEAQKIGGEILNADSVQIYKHLDIGSAKPSAEEREVAPHHLYDLVEPDIEFTAGDYRRHALRRIGERIEKAPLLVVGGSGFYIQALEFGMFDVNAISDEIQKRVAEIEATGRLYAELLKLDPTSAEKIGPPDLYRLRRALQVTLAEGRPFSTIQAEFLDKKESLGDQFTLKKVGLSTDRETLRRRVSRRTNAMLEAGLIDEVQGLVAKGYGETRVLRSVGYRECLDFLAGRLKREDLVGAIITSTMQLAKRQLTWFKRDKEITWISSS